MTDRIEIAAKDAHRAVYLLRNALKHLRRASGRPLDRHKRPVLMDSYDHAGQNILDAANALGISMGADAPEDLDLREPNA